MTDAEKIIVRKVMHDMHSAGVEAANAADGKCGFRGALYTAADRLTEAARELRDVLA